MSFLQKRIIHTSDWIVRGGIRESHDLEEQGKVSMLHILSWLGIFIMILIGVASLREGNPTVSYFDFSVATTSRSARGGPPRTRCSTPTRRNVLNFPWQRALSAKGRVTEPRQPQT
jgi:hypothetical protein